MEKNVLKVSDDSKQEVFQTFKLTLADLPSAGH